MNLGQKKCQPCEGGVPPLDLKEIKELKLHIKDDWEISENKKLIKEYSFVNYRHTMDFVNKVSALAEEEGHHPVMHVFYGRVVIELWTHAIDGLSENDFIMAYKVDKV
jgi:4a-hydroxytetrahydrobiopterin dehydratase